MQTIYYNNTTKKICERYPYDIPIDDNCSSIEVSDDVFEQTLVCNYGYIWKVINGVPVMVENEEVTNTPQYKISIKQGEIFDLKYFLEQTDYIISKIQEAQIEDAEEAEALKQTYASELQQRAASRRRINELESEIAALQSQL